MTKVVKVELTFETVGDVSFEDEENLRAWIDGTFDNAIYEEELGFSSSLEQCPPMVTGISVVEE